MTDKPLVILTWKDAHGGGNTVYHDHELPHAPILIHTVGWLLRLDAEGVSVGGELCEDGAWRSVTFVPAPLIVTTKYIVKPAKRPRKTPTPPPGAEAPSGS